MFKLKNFVNLNSRTQKYISRTIINIFLKWKLRFQEIPWDFHWNYTIFIVQEVEVGQFWLAFIVKISAYVMQAEGAQKKNYTLE